MKKISTLLLSLVIFISCQKKEIIIDQEAMISLGSKYKNEFLYLANMHKSQIAEDSSNVDAYIGYADAYILLYVFGYLPREIAIEEARNALNEIEKTGVVNSGVYKLSGVLSFIDWKWKESKQAFLKAIKEDPENLSARHWYSLWLIAMNDIDGAMAQSDTIMSMDSDNNFLIGRASLFYFQYRFEEMKTLMFKSIELDPEVPWSYDWLGMAYNGLKKHDEAINTYLKAFKLSDGTVEVGGGLGHALGNAGEYEKAKQLADYYEVAAESNYLPPVQRSFIHIGMKDYEKALELLEDAYNQQSWFLIFMQVEHWYDPIRNDRRFVNIMEKMNFPE